jgi:hypothetical protein
MAEANSSVLVRSVGVGSLCIAQLEQTAEVAVMKGEGQQKGRGWGHLLAGHGSGLLGVALFS